MTISVRGLQGCSKHWVCWSTASKTTSEKIGERHGERKWKNNCGQTWGPSGIPGSSVPSNWSNFYRLCQHSIIVACVADKLNPGIVHSDFQPENFTWEPKFSAVRKSIQPSKAKGRIDFFCYVECFRSKDLWTLFSRRIRCL